MADKKIKCLLLRDTWDADGVRHAAGEEIELPAEAAMDAVEAGAVKRAKEPKAKNAD